jgi:hypothetical protein
MSRKPAECFINTRQAARLADCGEAYIYDRIRQQSFASERIAGRLYRKSMTFDLRAGGRALRPAARPGRKNLIGPMGRPNRRTTGWWSTLDRAGREGERAFCLQAWNGDTGHTVDRIGRGTIHVEACCMSMLGGIQPARLRSYLVDAVQDGPGNDGPTGSPKTPASAGLRVVAHRDSNAPAIFAR